MAKPWYKNCCPGRHGLKWFFAAPSLLITAYSVCLVCVRNEIFTKCVILPRCSRKPSIPGLMNFTILVEPTLFINPIRIWVRISTQYILLAVQVEPLSQKMFITKTPHPPPPAQRPELVSSTSVMLTSPYECNNYRADVKHYPTNQTMQRNP